ncbi:MAG: NAD-dependent epimerase/dehydratase family protein [Nocardioidaceae bacterium]
MRIVIIGGTGNIGTALLRQLRAADENHEVHVVARRRPAQLVGDLRDVHMHSVDVASDDVRPLAEADAVVHLGWLFQPSHQPDITWDNNVVGTSRLLGCLRPGRASILVVASSIAAYSPVSNHRKVNESWSTHGASSAAYSREKAYVERLLDAFEGDHEDVRVVRVRPAFVFQRGSAA